MRRLLLGLWLACSGLPIQAQPSLTITAVGDLIPTEQARCGQAILPLLRQGDIIFGNLETPLVAAGIPTPGQVIHHRADPAGADQLAAVPFTVLSLANNHALDFGVSGLISTSQAVRRAGMSPLGVRDNESLSLEKNGLKLTLLAFSGGYPPTSVFPVCQLDSTVMEERVRQFASQGQLVVVSLHWGEENSDQPLEEQRQLAHRLVDAGAVLILGHHPHVLQGFEQRGRGLIVWSMGNFLWPGARGPWADSEVVHVTMTAQGVSSFSADPVQLVGGCPQPARGQVARQILSRLRLLSRELGTSVEIEGNRLVPAPPSPSSEMLKQGTVTLLEEGQRLWQSPPDRYVLKALAGGSWLGHGRQLVLLLETLTAEKRWVEDHFELAPGVRQLTQHLWVVGVGPQGGRWRTLWLSSPLDRLVLDLALEQKAGKTLLRALESDQGENTQRLYQWTGWAFQEWEDPALFHRRYAMVDTLLIPSGIRDPEVLEAARRIPRHLFVPPALQSRAYENCLLPIAGEQTIPEPTLMARMAQELELDGHERVLEIGTGSGYQAALLACLASQVYTVEIRPELGASARQAWRRLCLDNIHLKIGDGSRGWAEAGPFDAILVTAAPERIPRVLVNQLADGGRLLIPVGQGQRPKTLWRISKQGGKLSFHNLGRVKIVPMELSLPLRDCLKLP